eukprot:m.228943 g.228943  ORF g.228943 m.228943 type:complete len:369 (-) comp11817_c0_seq1:102-1208(-)
MVKAMSVQQQQQALAIMKTAIQQGKQLTGQQQQLMVFLEVQAVVQQMSPDQRKQALLMLKTAVSKGSPLNPQQTLLLSSLEEIVPSDAAQPPTSPSPASDAPTTDLAAEANARAEEQERVRQAEEKAAKARAEAEERAARAKAEADEKSRIAEEKARVAAEAKAAKERAAAEERAEKQRLAEEKARQAEERARQEAEAKAAKKRADDEAKAARDKALADARAKAAEEKKAAIDAQKSGDRRASTTSAPLKPASNSKSSLNSDMPKPWIYGRLSRDEARDILTKHMVKGHFLVRQSNTIPGGFALSLLVAATDPEPEHHVLHPDDKGNYTINGQSLGKACTTIQETIEYLIEHGHSGMSCRLTDVVYNK